MTEHRSAVAALAAKIRDGDELGPHQSKRLAHVDRIDRMLAEWDIQHLHLSSTMERAGEFTERGGDLLFGIFRPDDAYLIGIYLHGAWALRELVEVTVRNWPDAGLFLASNYVIDPSQNFTDEDRARLRQAGINAGSVKVDGRVYSPNVVGQTMPGGSVVVARRVNELMFRLWDLRENLAQRLRTYEEVADNAARRHLSGAWAAGVHDGACALIREDVFVGIESVN